MPSHSAPSRSTLERDGCLESCARLRAVVSRLAEHGDDTYAEIGPHARHCVEHLGALLRGLELGQVDYDARRRDLVLERSAPRLLDALEGMERRLDALDEATLARPIEVLHIAAPEAPPSASPSSVRRELAFLSSHTIHHLALIAAIAARRGVTVPDELLLAFSTAAHRQAVSR